MHNKARLCTLVVSFTLGVAVTAGPVSPAGYQAKAQELDWVTQAGGAGADRGFGVAVDGAGNALVTGTFLDTATFGEGPDAITLTAAGTVDAFVAKYGPKGTLLWVTQGGGVDVDFGFGVAVDGAGNVVVTGYFAGTATFGEGDDAITLTAAGSSDVFVAKYDPDGTLLWVTRGGDLGFNQGHGVGVDGAGNVIVTGIIRGTATFGEELDAITLTAAGTSDAFVAKYDMDGTLLWATQAGGLGTGVMVDEEAGDAVAVDGAGNAVVTGYFTDTATFGEGPDAITLTAAGISDAFVAKYDMDGTLLWAVQAGGPGPTFAGSAPIDRGSGVAVDGAGNIVVTGSFSGTALFGEGDDAVTLTAADISDAFVAKYDMDGTLLWAAQAGSLGSNQGMAAAVDGAGNAVVTGYFTDTATFSDAFVAKYDMDGTLLWATQAGSALFEFGRGVGVDRAGNAVVTGEFSGAALFGEGDDAITLTAAGVRDAFVAKWLAPPEEKLEVLIATLKALVAAGDLRSNIAAPLITKLEQVLDRLASDNLGAACDTLRALVNQAEALVRSGRLTAEDATTLLNGADEISAQLGC